MRPLLLALSIGLVGCEAAPAGPAPTLPLEDCHLQGSDRPARCGTLARPEDPAHPQAGELAIRAAVLPASDVARRNPLYRLAGGPGQAATEAFGPLLGRFATIA